MNAEHSPVVGQSNPKYVGWRGELLAKLALSRLPNLTIAIPAVDAGYDFAVITKEGFTFLVIVKAFSSLHRHIRDIERIAELRWQIPTKMMRYARGMHAPVILFLIDADSGHGRFLRLDSTHPSETRISETVRLPAENIITEDSLKRMIHELESARMPRVIKTKK